MATVLKADILKKYNLTDAQYRRLREKHPELMAAAKRQIALEGQHAHIPDRTK